MKKNRKRNLMLFASTGAMICTGSAAFANDPDVRRTGTYRVEEKVEVRTDSNLSQPEFFEPSGAQRSYHHSSTAAMAPFGRVHRANDLIGRDVRNHQNQKLGEIRDVMIDMNSGRIPFAVLSSDLGNRLVALPPSALTTRDNRLVLNMDREPLRSAPSFDRNQWPNMADERWSSDVYRYYGVEPYRHSSFSGSQPYYHRETYSERTFVDPAGAEYHHSTRGSINPELGEVQGITRLDDISGNRSRGGAVDLGRFAHRNEGPVGLKEDWHHSTARKHGTRQNVHERSTTINRMGGYHRVSDLIGMNVRNTQGQTIGEIRDVVLDLHSGNVAYAVIDADRFLNTRNEFVAVPPSLLRTSHGTRTLVMDSDRTILMNAPRVEMNNWTQASNEQFVSRVYRHYGQQPYWQAQGFRQDTQWREPSGAERNRNHQYQNNYQYQNNLLQQNQTPQQVQPFSQDNSSTTSFHQEQKFNEPAGAELQTEEPERSVRDAAISEIERPVSPQTQSSAPLETRESQASAPSAGFETQTEQQYRSEITVEQSTATTGAQLSEPSGAELEREVSVHEEKGEFVKEPAGAEPTAPEEYPVPTRTRPGGEVSEPSGADANKRAQDEHAEQVTEAAGAATSKHHDRALTQQVQTALKNDASLGAENIQVTTEDGKIVLRGTVKSETQKQQIEQKVQDVLLQNRIKVQDPQQP